MFDIYTIIFLALAVFIFLRLRSVLGQRTGSERPPYDYAARDSLPQRPASDKVIPLPTAPAEARPRPVEETPADRWQGIAEKGTALATGLDAIAAKDPSFDARHFLNGARAAYEMIVTAFARGDMRTLKDLLSNEVYDQFESVVRQREQRGERAETRFVATEKSDLTAAELRGGVEQITVKFVSQLVSTTYDKAGTVIDGSPDKVTDVTDLWTFARDAASRDPNWKLVATES